MESVRIPPGRAILPWVSVVLALLLAIGSGLLLTEILMAPPSAEFWELAAYFTIAAVATTAIGLSVIRLSELSALSIQSKLVLGTVIAGVVGLANTLIIAQLMFVSIDHDLSLLIATIVFAGIVMSVLSFRLARVMSARIGTITDAVADIAGGNLAFRIDPAGGDEIAQLASGVNTLAAQLSAAEEHRAALDRERRELTTAIAHDLRTPLSSLRAMAEALDDDLVDSTEARRYYATMRREVDRLSRMIDDLFELAQIDSGALRLNKRPLRIDEIATDVVDAAQPQAQRAGINLSVRIQGPTTAIVDGDRLERAIANLVRNAVEHTPGGGAVEVEVANVNGEAIVRVVDNGEGIDTADLPHIWDRFYRAEKSRRRDPQNGDGAGLGLAIVKGIVEAHGGSVDAESNPGRGATFVLRIQAAV